MGTIYLVTHAYTYNCYGRFENLMDAYNKAKNLMKIICPACKVVIDGEIVKYSYGRPKDKKHLHFKVCQYAKVEGCINDFSGDKKNDPYDFLDGLGI